MKIVIVSWVVLASLAAFGTTPQTGTPQTGVIKGTVVDAAGNPVAAAQVSTSVDLDSKDIIVCGPAPSRLSKRTRMDSFLLRISSSAKLLRC